MNVINFSGGRTSAYMTKRLIDEGLEDYIITFQNTGKEMPSTLDFINECDVRWNLNIIWLEYRFGNNFEVVNYKNASRDGRPFSELIAHKKQFLPSLSRRFCTDQLKIQTEKRYLKSIGLEQWIIYNGIRYDEPRRWSKIQNIPGYYDIEMPLVKMKVTKQDVLNWWKLQDFDLKLKEPYGNCDCCFLKGAGKLKIIAKEKPELLNWWINHEKNNGRESFKRGLPFEKILELSKMQSQLFDDDPTFECFCNID
jgi:hypothetical protein